MERDTHINAVLRDLKGGKTMAQVMVTVKIMPESPDVDMDSLSERVSNIESGRLNKVEREPIAFGLVALLAAYVVEDSEGTADNLENAIRELDDVQSTEIIEVTRLL